MNLEQDLAECEESKMEELNFHRSSISQIALHDFTLLKLIGEGGYGKVFLVQKKSDPNQLFAMKVLKKADICDSKKIQSIKTERNILASVKHPNVVGLKYAFQSTTKLFLVMEYCRGNFRAHSLLTV